MGQNGLESEHNMRFHTKEERRKQGQIKQQKNDLLVVGQTKTKPIDVTLLTCTHKRKERKRTTMPFMGLDLDCSRKVGRPT